MKKIILFSAVSMAFSFASCEKERNCKCSSTYTFGGTTTSASNTTTYKDVTKRHAKILCISSTETDANGGVTTTSCSLE